MIYKPSNAELWDTWYLAKEDKIHMYYLKFSKDKNTPEKNIGHAETNDLIEWQELDDVLGPSITGDEMQPWTGCAYFFNGTYFLYFTVRSIHNNGRIQSIGLATSKDNVKFTHYSKNPVLIPDSRWYVSKEFPLESGVVDCRDLIIHKAPDRPGWYGFFAARAKNKNYNQGAVIGLAYSENLYEWECLPPAFEPQKYACIEVPDVFFLDEHWYMTCLVGNATGSRVFREPNLTGGTIYAISSSIEGPYSEMKEDNVLIAGDKTCGYSSRSFVYKNELIGCFTERGTNSLSMPMKIITTKEGYLRYSYSDYSKAEREKEITLLAEMKDIYCHKNWSMKAGAFTKTANTYYGSSDYGWQITILSTCNKKIDINARIKLIDCIAAGLVLLSNINNSYSYDDYVFFLDKELQSVCASKTPYFDGQKQRKYDIEQNKAYDIKVIIKLPRINVYIDNILILNFEVEDSSLFTSPGIGLFVDRGTAEIEKVNFFYLK